MKKLLKKIIGVVILFSCLSINMVVVKAESFPNDGNAKEDPYGKCDDIPPSYKDVEYYDCAVPYNMSIEDIGGYSTEVIAYISSDYNFIMPDNRKQGTPGACYGSNYFGDRLNDAPFWAGHSTPFPPSPTQQQYHLFCL